MDTETIRLEDFCKDCATRKTCSKPCKPIERWLRHGKSMVFESKEGEYTVLYSHDNEVKFSELDPVVANQDQSLLFADKVAETEKVIPIRPKQQRARVFYQRFFCKLDYESIAFENELSVRHCRAVFSDGKRRLLKIVEALDGRDYGLKHVQAGKKFSDDEKWFLMVKVFGFSIAEIQRMPGCDLTYGALKKRLLTMHNKFDGQFKEVA